MPLNPSVLTTQLQSFLDKDAPNFVGFPEDVVDAANKWANAMDVYTGSGLIIFAGAIPAPSTTGAVAKEALATALLGMAVPPAALAVFDTAFVAYALTLGAGMAPAFVNVPPAPGLLSAAMAATALLNLPPNAPKTTPQSLALMAATFDSWFRFNILTPAAGPPSFPWT